MALRKSPAGAAESALSGALLHLYRLSRTTPAPEYKNAALEALKHYLPFSAAMWGTFVISGAGPVVHAVHLHRLPKRKMHDYEQVKQSDILYRKGIAKPGRTSVANLTKLEGDLDPGLVEYARRYDLENVLSTVWKDTVLQIYTAVSFYRGEAGKPFTERERRLKEQLMPHLVEAWNLNAIRYVDRPTGAQPEQVRMRALVDREGMVYNAEPGFAELMRAEFPEWRGPVLPQMLSAPLIGAGAESFRGEAIVASRLREIEEGMFLISARALAGIDRLSPRELSVARAFATGKTHKQIAAALGIAPATVRNQLQSAYAKLNVNSKIGLARQLSESD